MKGTQVRKKNKFVFLFFNFSGFSVNISTTGLYLLGKALVLSFMSLALTLHTAWKN